LQEPDSMTRARGVPHISVLYELCDSGSLADLLMTLRTEDTGAAGSIVKTLDRVDALRVLTQVVCGLCYLHLHTIVHGNLRPSKILFSSSGTVKVSDFGVPWKQVCCGRSAAQPEVHDWEQLLYAAPEVLDGRAKCFSSDIWSLGIIALQLLTGEIPYTGPGYQDLTGAALSKEIARRGINLFFGENFRPTGLRVVQIADADADCRYVLTSSLAFEPSQRASAEEISKVILN
jgi:serine/threonine protein kinase